MQQRAHLRFQLGDTLPCAGRELGDVRDLLSNLFYVYFAGEVALIDDRHHRAVLDLLDQFHILLGQLLRGIEYRQHQITSIQTFSSKLDAHLLHRVVGVAQAGGVRQVEHDVAQADGVLHDVAGGAGDLCDDALFLSGKQVHQRRFADVWPPDDDGADPFPQDFAVVIAAQDVVQPAADLLHPGAQVVVRDLVDVLVRVIDPGRQRRGDGEHPVDDLMDFGKDGAVLGLQSRLGALLPLGGDQVHHRFGLGQAHLAV